MVISNNDWVHVGLQKLGHGGEEPIATVGITNTLGEHK
jgi:hypothetical protein